MKKLVAFFLIITIFFGSYSYVLADDINEEEETDITYEEILETSTNADITPKINSRYCVIFDRDSKKVIYEKNAYSKTPMASTTKIMTAIVVLENANLEDIVTVSKKAGNTGGSRLGLKANDKVSVNDLLYGLMMRSR